MAIELKLDDKAVAFLFPEGSEAHLRLQNAVIDQVIRRTVTKNLDQLNAIIQARVDELFNVALVAKGVSLGAWRTPQLSNPLQAEIVKKAREAIDNAIKEGFGGTPATIEQIRADAFKKVEEQLALELSMGLEARVNRLVKTALKNAVGG